MSVTPSPASWRTALRDHRAYTLPGDWNQAFRAHSTHPPDPSSSWKRTTDGISTKRNGITIDCDAYVDSGNAPLIEKAPHMVNGRIYLGNSPETTQNFAVRMVQYDASLFNRLAQPTQWETFCSSVVSEAAHLEKRWPITSTSTLDCAVWTSKCNDQRKAHYVSSSRSPYSPASSFREDRFLGPAHYDL